MKEKEKATLGGISAEGSDGQQITLPGFEKLSENDFIMQAGKTQPSVAGLLMTGAQNAITLSELARITGRDTRTVRLLIRQDRAKGFPVCADNSHGYYMPGSEAEKSACVRSMRRRAAEIRRTASYIEGGEVLSDG